MTTIFQRAEQTYTPKANGDPRIFTFNPTIPANATILEFSFTLTRVNWSDGDIATIVVDYPDGTNVLSATVAGGPARTSFSRVGMRSESPLPTGQYTITVSVLQPVTTAITADIN